MKSIKEWFLIGLNIGAVAMPAAELFDIAAIRDASTLDVKVLKDWSPVRGVPSQVWQLRGGTGNQWLHHRLYWQRLGAWRGQ